MIDIQNEVMDLNQLSKDDVIEYGKNCLACFIVALRKNNPKISNDSINEDIVTFARLIVSADKNCEEEELEYFKLTTFSEVNYDDFFNFTNRGSDSVFIKNCVKKITEYNVDARNNIIKYFLGMTRYKGGILASEIKIFSVINK